MALFIYGTATNYGKNFFTHEDRRNFFLRGYPAEVWAIGNNEKGALWLAEKNKVEAQALIDAEIEASQAAWDALPEEEKAPAVEGRPRPGPVTLP